MISPPALQAAVAALERLHPPGEVMTDPMALIVWENVGYLVDDNRRAELFDVFVARVGLDPRIIAKASQDLLLELASRGGMRPQERARRLRCIGELAPAHAGGDLVTALKALPSAKARALLKRFPGMGDPGADKIMLFCGLEARPALESNGLRVLVRLGYAPAEADYARTYRSAVEVLRAQGRPDRDWLVMAFQCCAPTARPCAGAPGPSAEPARWARPARTRRRASDRRSGLPSPLCLGMKPSKSAANPGRSRRSSRPARRLRPPQRFRSIT